MDTTIMYNPKNEDGLYDASEAGPETKLKKMRSDLFKETRGKYLLNMGKMSQEEFNRYYKDRTLDD